MLISLSKQEMYLKKNDCHLFLFYGWNMGIQIATYKKCSV